ncbi:2-polyprenylphenol 6-hydroxylase [Rickettsia prowazekii]|uniref:2-polyprenylphenol6-hydroxylase n=1 Tax=Rickettsia prowazekii (strain Rp22) TaxID=449216 RepID=D5AXT6_RICPP|nr:2-polyprenylphenol 6-hydroxylase [Rickettsia prowazekii]ADE30225.1 2-polyprenylphenol6-hydroxylase [Rickettsia prowazekii str. Rp22]AFE49477.1 ubiquinone biosynthesis protein [Rickettsia prowazekii str. Chernikova]AFE50321.1 ubiquinone biosynthesis protein [Rickettsia prowazekii str. Katsinyian]AFE51167.1 ubiquinone biosynthesis protein [Rickettsia prowazekii str. BuV67-CWPP]AFE52003.1 ubiquinone biosynthesis protein [Rickettsia prowazekii str. Dachau]
MISIFLNLIRIFRIVSKKQILIDSRSPKYFRFIGYILALFFAPSSLIKKSREDYGKRLTDCLTDLGPIYIKFGQTLSTRADLVGAEIACYLRLLQDKLPPFDGAVARKLIYKSFIDHCKGEKSADAIISEHKQNVEKHSTNTCNVSLPFLHFDNNPIAAASISQVHKAQLITGGYVALKILRPDIRKKYNRDIKLLYFFAKIISKFSKAKRLKPITVIDKFHETMRFELDLRLEAAAASELKDNMRHDINVIIPKIYWDLTSENILTTEWLDGTSIYDISLLKEMNLEPKKIAQDFAVMFFNQAYRDGFFHADLHAGNILVNNQGKIILLDFGIMGRLKEKDRLSVAEILFAFLKRDYKLVAKVHLRAGYIPANTDLDLFAGSCRAVTEPIVGTPTKNISIGKLLTHLFKITEDFGMEVQPDLLILQKTLIMVEGIGRQLDSNVNMWQLAEPWIKKWAVKNLSPEAKLLRLIKHYLNSVNDIT